MPNQSGSTWCRGWDDVFAENCSVCDLGYYGIKCDKYVLNDVPFQLFLVFYQLTFGLALVLFILWNIFGVCKKLTSRGKDRSKWNQISMFVPYLTMLYCALRIFHIIDPYSIYLC